MLDILKIEELQVLASLVMVAILVFFLLRLALHNRYNVYLDLANEDRLMLILDHKRRIEIFTDGIRVLFPKVRKSMKFESFMKDYPDFMNYTKGGEFVLFLNGERYSARSRVKEGFEVIEIENVSIYLKKGANSIRKLFQDFSQTPLSFRVNREGRILSSSIEFSKYWSLFDNVVIYDIQDVGIYKEDFMDLVFDNSYVNGSISIDVDGLKIFDVYINQVDDESVIINYVLSGEITPFSSSHYDVLGTLINAMEDGLVSIDNFGKITFANQKMYELIGTSDLRDRNILELFKLYDRNDRLIDLSFPLKAQVQEYRWLETPFKDSRVVVELVVSEVIEMDGLRSGYVLSFRDTSLRQSLLMKSYRFAFRDALTGSYNRHYLKEFIETVHRERTVNLGVVIVDCNGLKVINDAFGHQMGDKVIQRTYSVLQANIKEKDSVIRIGGDEFAVILQDVTSDEVMAYVDGVQRDVSEVSVNGLPLSISLGYSHHNEGIVNVPKLMEVAEYNMYLDKMFEGKKSRDNLVQYMYQTLVDRNPQEKTHSEFVERLSYDLASELNLGEDFVDLITSAAKYHAIGKIVLDEDDQYDEDHHTEYSFRIFSAMPEYSYFSNTVLLYKENFDGTGRLQGLKGSEIPIGSRILRIAIDVSYLLHFSPEELVIASHTDVMEHISKESGRLYDPNIVSVLDKVLKRYEFKTTV